MVRILAHTKVLDSSWLRWAEGEEGKYHSLKPVTKKRAEVLSDWVLEELGHVLVVLVLAAL